jgi:outer membrane biosynthesis protein TonB
MEASVIDGDPRLDALAVEAVKTWLYEPVLLNGVPVEAVTEVNVDFQTKPKKVKK